MTTITREQALKIIEAADEVISALAGTNEDVHPGSDNMLRLWDDLNDRYAPPEVVRELARIALASLEVETVSQTHKLPHTQFEQVADLYEMQFDDGRTCAFHTDAQKAAQWIQACDGNRVQEYVKLERLQNALSGNSPGTPDSWIPVSERMPEPYEYVLVTDGFDGCEVMRVNTDGYWGPAKSLYPGGITHWMPLPEPPQEAK
ncbi:DUF551 domain-containing protein [Escherichia coli]|uniref:DUF551 domain-containing protein n=1 Tax=Escherichia coli TaxID=562 RepID=UPI003CEB61BE